MLKTSALVMACALGLLTACQSAPVASEALGNLENDMPGFVKNYSFNNTIEGDKIIFDYKLTPGMCGSFNASKLMQLMGIAIEEA